MLGRAEAAYFHRDMQGRAPTCHALVQRRSSTWMTISSGALVLELMTIVY